LKDNKIMKIKLLKFKIIFPIFLFFLFFAFAPKAMAAGCAGTGNCYWVGGAGDWSNVKRLSTTIEINAK